MRANPSTLGVVPVLKNALRPSAYAQPTVSLESLLIWNGSVQWTALSGDVTRYKSVGSGVSVQFPLFSVHCVTKPTGSSLCRTDSAMCTWWLESTVIVEKILSALSPIFVVASKAPCHARWDVQVAPPSVDADTQALLKGPIWE